jgi:hypothetical protein
MRRDRIRSNTGTNSRLGSGVVEADVELAAMTALGPHRTETSSTPHSSGMF